MTCNPPARRIRTGGVDGPDSDGTDGLDLDGTEGTEGTEGTAAPPPPGILREPAAFEREARRLTRPMTDQAFRLLGDHGHSEDVVQEALLQMWQHRERYDPLRGSLATWAVAIVRHLSINRIRHDQAVRRREELFAGRSTLIPYDEVVDAVECLLEYEHVRLRLGALSDLQRQAIELVYFDHLNITEAAARLGIPAPTLRTRLRDARSALERILRLD